MTKQELIERIIETIYENVTQDITGDALQGVLRDMVGSLVTADELNEEIENEKDARESADALLQGLVDAINAKIPSAASASNQLADKAFVNSSIATGTATFRGTSAKNLTEAQFLAWANTLPHDLNDYIFWDTSDTLGNQQFKRYKYTGSQWQYEYTLNNSTFTAAQWETINSGLTSGDKDALDEALETIDELCAPAYTIASSLADLVSGEDYKVAFGKIAKAVNSLISHLNDNVRHITSSERTAWNNKKDLQTPKASPETDGEEIAFIDTISQNAQGVITATRKEVREASSEQSGVVSTDAQSFSGNKTFDDALIGKKGVAAGGATSDNAIGGSGVTDHRLLEHRDANNQHPISAITDLEDTLDELSGGLETEAQARVQADQSVLSSAATDASNKVNSHNASNNAHPTLFNSKVDKVEGKGLSTNDFTDADKSKLDSLHNYDDTELRVEDANIHIDIIREGNERKTADAELKAGVIENAQAIQAEETARTIADQALSRAINNEVERAQGVESTLATELQNKKDKQTAVDVSGSNVKTITRLQQNTQGVVTPTFTDIPSAGASQKGLMDTTAQTFGGNKTFNGSVISQQGIAAGGSTSDTAIGTSGTTDHRQLTNRDANNQHPISSITNLQDTLDALDETDEGLQDALDIINSKIPSEATSTNKLADKAFVNSSISTNTATFRGTSASGLSEAQFLAWANGLTHDLNDYVFWNTTDSAGNVQFKRYKYNGSAWVFEYTLNNSSFTASQWATIQSGLTSSDKTNYNNHLANTNNPHGVTKTQVGLGNVDNTSDANKPISTATQTALNGKVDKTTTINGHALSGNVTVTKGDVGLGNVDNTSDLNKPISTATQTALTQRDIEDANIHIDIIRESNERKTADAELAFKTSIIGEDLSVSSPAGVAAGGVASDSAIGTEGTTDHRQLTHRNESDQHSISSITNLEDTLDSKQDVLTAGSNIQINGTTISATDTITTATTSGSGNAVTAVTATNGQLTVIKGTTFLTSHQDISGKEDKSNKVTSWGTPTDTQYPSAKLVKDSLNTKQDNLPTSGTPTASYAINITGSANKLETARKITIGNKENTFDGSSDITYTLAQIGAKPLQTAKSDPTASGTTITAIDTITQDEQGVITATKKTIRDASASQSGVVSTTAQTFGGNKTFNGSVISQQGIAAGGSTSDTAIGTSGTTDHRQLTNRDAAEQHPISAITGLTNALNGKQDVISDLGTIRSGASAGATAYQKPTGGIPKADLTSAVQTSLGKADSALQQHQSLDGYVNGITTDSTTSFADSSTIVVGKSGKNILTRTAQALFNYIKSKLPSWSTADTKPTYTKSEIGLGNVDNTSDLNKPISTATQTALTQRDIEDANIRIDLQREGNERKTADAELKTDILNEATTRASEDTSIRGALSTEAEERRAADSGLATRIGTEETTRAGAVISLTTAISNEATTRASEDTSIRNAMQTKSAMITSWLGTPDHNHYPSAKLTRDSIDVVQSNLTNEATTRANTDLALQVEDANQNINIQREVHERKTADADFAFRTSIVKDDLSVVTPSGVASGGITSDAGLRPYKFITQISATGDVSQNIVHNLGSADVVVTIHKNTNGYWQPDSSMYRIVDNNTINVYPYSTGTYRITIIV